MNAGVVQSDRKTIDRALNSNPKLVKLFLTMVEAAEGPNLSTKSLTALQRSLETFRDAACSAPGEYIVIERRKAVVGTISVKKGQQLETLLLMGGHYEIQDQVAHIAKLGFVLATRAQNEAYLKTIVAKQKTDNINGADSTSLCTYRNITSKYGLPLVKDQKGGLRVDDDLFVIAENNDGVLRAGPSAALYVRILEKSK